MRNGLKTLHDMQAGKSLEIEFGGDELLLDPAGVLIIKSINALVVSDLHLEKGSSFARRGQFLPPYDTVATLTRLATLIHKYNPSMIVSLGDSFHDDEASHRLGDETIEALQAMTLDREMIWITGNHDPSPPDHLPGQCFEEIAIGKIVLRHIPDVQYKNHEISGHFHPCAKVQVRGKNVRRPCFACDGTRMIMPSFGVLTGGLNISNRAFNGLFHRNNLRAYMQGKDRVFPIASENISGFGQ